MNEATQNGSYRGDIKLSTRRRHAQSWCNQVMYRHWILDREEEGIAEEEELTEEQQERLQRSMTWHPSRGPLPQIVCDGHLRGL
jgi:hypothetical protein